MSDEELTSDTTEETESTVETGAPAEAVSNNDSLREKFRLTGDEQILKDVKP